MAFRRFKSFAGRGFNPPYRFRRSPGKLIWATASTPVAFNTTSAAVALVSPAQWVVNTAAGGFEHAKVLQLVLSFAEPSVTAFAANQQFAPAMLFTIDDTGAVIGSPSVAATYAATQPFRCETWSYVSPAANIAYNTNLQNNPTGARRIKVNRNIRSDQTLWLGVTNTPSASFNFVQPMLTRALIRLS